MSVNKIILEKYIGKKILIDVRQIKSNNIRLKETIYEKIKPSFERSLKEWVKDPFKEGFLIRDVRRPELIVSIEFSRGSKSWRFTTLNGLEFFLGVDDPLPEISNELIESEYSAKNFNQGYGCYDEELGITLRDYFAAKAMQTMVAGQGAKMVADRDGRYNETNWAEVVAANAYEFADAMLKERIKTNKS